MTKTSKPSMPKPKVTRVTEEYRSIFSNRLTPITENFIDATAEELVNWAINDSDALTLGQFWRRKGLDRTDYNRWADKFPQLRRAMELAKEAIADRREMGAIHKKYDTSTIAFMMPHYSQDWKDMNEWRAKIRNQTESESNIKVVIQQYPGSEMVPAKKVEE